MKIAVHVGSDEWGGAEVQLARLTGALVQRGHDVRVFCNQPGHVSQFRQRGVTAERIPLGGDAMVPHALRFAAVLRRFAPDALLIGTFKKLWLAGLAARLARVPRVLARVGLQTDTARNLKYRVALRWLVDAVVVNAAAQADAFVALPGWSAARVHTIYNYYDAGVTPPGSVRAQLALDDAVPVVGAVGRLAPQKKLHRLLGAVAGLERVHCIIAGDGVLRGELESHAAELGIQHRVHFLGYLADVRPVLAALDVFVICSDREGMSNAMVEALAAGVPVVSTPVSGAREALEPLPDGSAPGLIVEPAGLRDALAQVLDSPETQAAMRRAARLRVADRFAPEVIVARWERVLRGEAV